MFRAFQLWITVAPWEMALRVRGGKNAVKLGPGIHFRIPFLDRLFVQSSKLITIGDSGQTICTRDGKPLTIAVSIFYLIADINQLYMKLSAPEHVLLAKVQSLIAQQVASLNASEIFPSDLESKVSALVPAAEWGLRDVGVLITTFVYAKPIRIFNNEFRWLTGTNSLDKPNA